MILSDLFVFQSIPKAPHIQSSIPLSGPSVLNFYDTEVAQQKYRLYVCSAGVAEPIAKLRVCVCQSVGVEPIPDSSYTTDNSDAYNQDHKS